MKRFTFPACLLALLALALALPFPQAIARKISHRGTPSTHDWIIRLQTNTLDLGRTRERRALQLLQWADRENLKIEELPGNFWRIQGNISATKIRNQIPDVAYAQPNFRLRLDETFSIEDELRLTLLQQFLQKHTQGSAPSIFIPPEDNPPYTSPPKNSRGKDPLLSHQWGLESSQTRQAWKTTQGREDFIVAVLDTGVDYTHEDLIESIWKNPGEWGADENGHAKESNGIDDDLNGYVDDAIGWDFFSNDARPYDLTAHPQEIVKGQGNPGHGTHCAGTIAASANNGLGISGVAPKVKIMPLRFLDEKGFGSTADAIKGIYYAVQNGAKIISSSWGSEGERPDDEIVNHALREAIQFAKEAGVLFIATAGNGRGGKGYDNDRDPAPAFPASYDMDNIISVTAHDSQDQLPSFANWGATSVDIAAPGVGIFSTMPGNRYSDIALDFFGFKSVWDGTSMAVPYVSGALALYWSKYPHKKWSEVKAALLESATPAEDFLGKTLTGGKLNTSEMLDR